ncbi:MAG: YceI family protein [Thermoanaerobaculia bacterium]|nr:YceI family protein [Thermoanaerobaculia bacterium]
MHTSRLFSRTLLVPVAALLALPLLAAPAQAAWKFDPGHSKVSFTVSHFFTPVEGSFDDVAVNINFDPANLEASSVDATIKVASVNTASENRDKHLASPDFFEAEKFPEMTFKSTSVKKVGENKLVARGPLTIKGVSKDVELAIDVLGVKELPAELQEAFGGLKAVASFKATTKINRNDFGVGVGSYAATLVVGDEISIEILVEAHQQ